jgi:hypothetical protein
MNQSLAVCRNERGPDMRWRLTVLLRSFVATAAFVAAVVLGAGESRAGLMSMLSLDGNTDSIEDNGQAVIFDNPNGVPDNVVSVGDQVVGIIELEKVNSVEPAPRGFFAAFVAEVTSARLVGTIPVIGLGPVSHGDPHGLKSILSASVHPAGYTDAEWDKTIFIVLENDDVVSVPSRSPFHASHNGAPAISVITSVYTSANGYHTALTGGFNTPNDFFDAAINTSLALATISDLRADNSGRTVLYEHGGFSVLKHELGAAIGFLPVSISHFDGGSTSHDFILNPDGAVQTSGNSVPNWDFTSDANFALNVTAIPEPGAATLAIVGLAVLSLTVRRLRHRSE